MHAGEPTRGPSAQVRAARLDSATAAAVAATLQALATTSRLMILATLRDKPHPVADLAATIGMEPSAVSHQLRLLRTLGMVARHREGRRIVYTLYDDHVAQLLDQAVHHSEHLRLGLVETP
ncbi:ArsR/SmtB family transcription factor [Streptomyces sp. NPDC057743]|uniref:ArsR/SmtB family transcription factor n=1 Tax=Streptomyces sp. NPDC057743 TaxID=3346236 RepID=UPI003673BF75